MGEKRRFHHILILFWLVQTPPIGCPSLTIVGVAWPNVCLLCISVDWLLASHVMFFPYPVWSIRTTMAKLKYSTPLQGLVSSAIYMYTYIYMYIYVHINMTHSIKTLMTYPRKKTNKQANIGGYRWYIQFVRATQKDTRATLIKAPFTSRFVHSAR
jgi:hypothetical protein